jgi:hypothetical protein
LTIEYSMLCFELKYTCDRKNGKYKFCSSVWVNNEKLAK